MFTLRLMYQTRLNHTCRIESPSHLPLVLTLAVATDCFFPFTRTLDHITGEEVTGVASDGAEVVQFLWKGRVGLVFITVWSMNSYVDDIYGLSNSENGCETLLEIFTGVAEGVEIALSVRFALNSV